MRRVFTHLTRLATGPFIGFFRRPGLSHLFRSVRARRLRAPSINMAQDRLIDACPPSRLGCLELFFSDMDGTWLGSEHAPTPGGIEAIKELEAAGLMFAFATGRCVASAEEASGLSLRGRPGVYSNGAVVLGAGGKELYSLDLPAGVIEQSVRLGTTAGEVSVLLVKIAAT